MLRETFCVRSTQEKLLVRLCGQKNLGVNRTTSIFSTMSDQKWFWFGLPPPPLFTQWNKAQILVLDILRVTMTMLLCLPFTWNLQIEYSQNQMCVTCGMSNSNQLSEHFQWSVAIVQSPTLTRAQECPLIKIQFEECLHINREHWC